MMLTQQHNEQQANTKMAEAKKITSKKVCFFGKKHKNAYETSWCLYQSIETFLADTKSQKKQQKMGKYIQRCYDILQNSEECKLKELLSSEYFNKSLFILLGQPEHFNFEEKKRTYNMLRMALIDSQAIIIPPINYTEQYFKTQNLNKLIMDLSDKFTQMSFYVGNTLRIVAECPELFNQILTVDLLKKLIGHLSSNHFEIQSEIIETLNHFFLNKTNPNIKNLSSKFLKEQAVQSIQSFNQILEKSESYSTIRMLLRTLYKILSDPIYQSYTYEYLKNIDNLKIIMNFTANEDSGIKKEALLFLDLFINLLEEKQDEKLKQIFQKNYKNLINVIKSFSEVDLEGETEEQDKVDTNFLIHRLHTVSF